MVHCVVCCRHVPKSCSHNLPFLVTIINVGFYSIFDFYMTCYIESSPFNDVVFFDGKHYSVQDQMLVEFVHVVQKGYRPVVFMYRLSRVFIRQ